MKQNSSNHLYCTSNSNFTSDCLPFFFFLKALHEHEQTHICYDGLLIWQGYTVFCRHTCWCSTARGQMRKVSFTRFLALLAHQVCGMNGAHQISMAAPSNWDLQKCGHPQHVWNKHSNLYRHLYKPVCNLAQQTRPTQVSHNHHPSASAVDSLPKGPQKYSGDRGEQVSQISSQIAFCSFDCDLYLP